MSKLRTVLTECAHEVLTDGRCEVDDIIDCAYRNHSEVFEEETRALVLNAARLVVRTILKDLTSDDDEPQLRLPGLHLPSAICVRVEGGTYYVRADKATWPELEAGRAERENNVSAAQVKLQHYNETLDRLRPWMQHDPKCTVAAALEREQNAA